MRLFVRVCICVCMHVRAVVRTYVRASTDTGVHVCVHSIVRGMDVWGWVCLACVTQRNIVSYSYNHIMPPYAAVSLCLTCPQPH